MDSSEAIQHNTRGAMLTNATTSIILPVQRQRDAQRGRDHNMNHQNDCFSPLMSPEDRDVARRCVQAVEKSEEFAELAVGEWRVSPSQVCSGHDVVERYKAGGVNREEWYPALKSAVSHLRLVCIIEVENNDRKGLEHLPPHVLGYAGTFLVDVDTLEVVHVLKTLYMT